MNLFNKKENKMYSSMILGFVILFAVFLTSKEWLYDDDPIRHTPFGEQVTKLNQTDIKVTDWQYNKHKKFMEVQIKKDISGDDSLPPNLKFQGYNHESNDKIKTEKAYENDDMILVTLSNVEDDLRFIDLKINEVRDDEAISEDSSSADIDADYNKTPDEEKNSSVILFGDYRKININNKLKKRSDKGYEKLFVKNDIDHLSEEKKKIQEEKIPEENNRIVRLQDEIDDMKEELQYTTGEEKSDLESDIKGNENKIENAIEHKSDLKDDIKALERKMNKYSDKYKDIDKSDI